MVELLYWVMMISGIGIVLSTLGFLIDRRPTKEIERIDWSTDHNLRSKDHG